MKGSVGGLLALLLVAVCVAAQPAAAQSSGNATRYNVCISNLPPMAECDAKNPPSTYTGLDVELFRKAAQLMNWDYEFQCIGFQEMLDRLRAGNDSCSMATSSITITAERQESGIQFSFPYMGTGLGIMVRTSESSSNGWSTWLAPYSVGLWIAVVLTVLIFPVFLAMIEWFSLRREKPKLAEGYEFVHNATVGAVWALTGMETIPVSSHGAKMASVSFAFLCVILLTTYTANLASSLTVRGLESQINTLADLKAKLVYTLDIYVDRLAARYDINAVSVPFEDDIMAVMAAKVETGDVAAFLADDPGLLGFLAQREGCSLGHLPFKVLEPLSYGVAFQKGFNETIIDQFSIVIIELQDTGEVDKLQSAFTPDPADSNCAQVLNEATAATLQEAWGVFIVLIVGILVGFAGMFFTRYWRAKQNSKWRSVKISRQWRHAKEPIVPDYSEDEEQDKLDSWLRTAEDLLHKVDKTAKAVSSAASKQQVLSGLRGEQGFNDSSADSSQPAPSQQSFNSASEPVPPAGAKPAFKPPRPPSRPLSAGPKPPAAAPRPAKTSAVGIGGLQAGSSEGQGGAPSVSLQPPLSTAGPSPGPSTAASATSAAPVASLTPSNHAAPKPAAAPDAPLDAASPSAEITADAAPGTAPAAELVTPKPPVEITVQPTEAGEEKSTEAAAAEATAAATAAKDAASGAATWTTTPQVAPSSYVPSPALSMDENSTDEGTAGVAAAPAAAAAAAAASQANADKVTRLSRLVHGLKQKVERLQGENIQLEEMLAAADAAHRGGSGEIARLEAALAKEQAARVTAEASLHGAVAARETDAAALREQVESTTARAAALEAALAARDEERATAEAERSVSEGQLIATLRKEVEAAESQLEEERKAHAVARRASSAREQEQDATLADAAASLAAMQRTVEERSARASAAEDRCHALETEVEALTRRAQVAEAKAEAADAAAAGASAPSSASQRVEELEEALNEMRKVAAAAAAEAATSAEDAARMKSEVATLQRQLVDARSSDAAELRHRLQEATDALYAKQAQLERVTADRAAAQLQLERQMSSTATADTLKRRTAAMDRALGGTMSEDGYGGIVPMDSLGGAYVRLANAPGHLGGAVKAGARLLDTTASQAVRILRQYPLGRLGVFCYIVGMHFFIYLLLHRLQRRALMLAHERAEHEMDRGLLGDALHMDGSFKQGE